MGSGDWIDFAMQSRSNVIIFIIIYKVKFFQKQLLNLKIYFEFLPIIPRFYRGHNRRPDKELGYDTGFPGFQFLLVTL